MTSAENDRCSLGEPQLLQLPGTTSSDVEDVCGPLSPLPWTASKNEGMAGEGGNLLQDFLMWWDPECQDPGRRTSRSNAGGVNTNRSTSADTSPSPSLPSPDERLDQTSGPAPSRASETLKPVASLAEHSSSDPSDTRVLAADTKRSRARRKDEVQMLRKEAHALGETLRALQQAARNPWKHTQDPWRLSEAPCTLVWKPVAERQRVRMESTQRENLELKLRVLEYKKLANSLRRALVKRVKRVVLLTEMMRLPPLRLLSALDLSSDDCTIFQRTVADIDSMCRNVDSALGILQTTTAKSTDRGSFRKGAARLDASMAIFAEIVSCERVPFRKEQVKSAMRLLHEDVKPGSRRYNAKRFGGAPQMIVTKARFRYPWSTGSGTFCACRAKLSFDDGARSGSVGASYIAALDSEGKSVPGFLLKVQMWTILTEQVRAGTEETLIQTYTTIAPVQTSERCPFRWEREVVEQVVIPEWDRGIAGGRRELESMLIDRASS